MQRFALTIVAALFSGTCAYAQQESGPASVLSKYTEYLNAGDAEQLRSLYAADAIDINPMGKLKAGTPQFAEATPKYHRMGLKMQASVDEVQPVFGGQGALVTANYTTHFDNASIPPGKGIILMVLERSADGWKILAVSASRAVPQIAGHVPK